MTSCFICGHRWKGDFLKCPSCGRWNSGNVHSEQPGIPLCKIKSLQVDRISTGPWDHMWGTNWDDKKEGIVPKSVTLIGGSPGAGKSTLLLMIAFAGSLVTGKESIYYSCEEPAEQVKGRADRLGYTVGEEYTGKGQVRFIDAMGKGGVLPEPGTGGLLIYDSLNASSGDDMKGAVLIARSLKDYALASAAPVITISHINKRGDIAGLEALQHWVDTTMTFFPTEESLGEESPRELVVEKNRNGPAYLKMVFMMTEKGLIALEKDDE